MKSTELNYIVQATGGKLYATAANGEYNRISSVAIDNRKIKDECLFFCIIGARTDAHTLLDNVRDRGCHNVVVSDEKWAEKMASYGDMNVVLVEDTLIALDNLTEKYMDDWEGLKKVAVTGSAGKTTTKADSVDNAVAQIAANEEAQDDTELIAVIAAAIAASEGAASADGYVVRSVRRRY